MSSDSLMETPMRPAHTEKYSATLMTLRDDGLKQPTFPLPDPSMLMYVSYIPYVHLLPGSNQVLAVLPFWYPDQSQEQWWNVCLF